MKLLVPGALLTLLFSAPTAQGALLYATFSVTATSGPLNGTTATGDFSYDDSSITPGAANNAAGLLISLNFTWNSIVYTSATANTGGLTFDAGGNLTQAFFGTNCSAGNCSSASGIEGWTVTAGLNPVFFDYTVGGTPGLFAGTAILTTPEPATLSLAAAALFVLLGVRKIRPMRH